MHTHNLYEMHSFEVYHSVAQKEWKVRWRR